MKQSSFIDFDDWAVTALDKPFQRNIAYIYAKIVTNDLLSIPEDILYVLKVYGTEATLDWIRSNRGIDPNNCGFDFRKDHHVKYICEYPNFSYKEFVRDYGMEILVIQISFNEVWYVPMAAVNALGPLNVKVLPEFSRAVQIEYAFSRMRIQEGFIFAFSEIYPAIDPDLPIVFLDQEFQRFSPHNPHAVKKYWFLPKPITWRFKRVD